ncbi:uncharacterized protein TRAVEDRAFT_39705 [Trametes versicolor FP-101664 SS1]|uniref:uncharacterized protein n=1 Tax=Trametes versicolor (strain FP-101664) TaxID=717944 RepID=UPI0004622878|nr:uncharacterized protein TRAVEDRAFT_39705 [Trametes versicolor FP-101664 SS1]EIW54008.1 hypothetical protein TRAVEDRAFT_39705 [Trametes versicolor FP-101664 SS1]
MARDGRFTLACSARVCRAFLEPALDALWRDLGDLLVLLRVLPSFQPYTSHSFNFLDEITPSQWLRFQSYARRVRALQKGALGSSVETVDKMVWATLGSRLNGQPLLPNLRTFVSDFAEDYLAPLVLLSPSLLDLELWFPCADAVDDDPVFASSLPLARGVLVQSLTPHLRKLSRFLIYDGLEGTPARFLSAFLTPLDRLQALDLVASKAIADLATLQAISEMTALRELGIRLSLAGTNPTMLPQLGGAYSALHRLHLRGKIHDMCTLFQACDCAQLDDLALTVHTLEGLQEGLASICDRLPKSLRHARVTILGRDPPPEPSTPAIHVLRPFFVFRDLRTVSMSTNHYDPGMDDGFARESASAWPQLTHFELGYLDSCSTLDPAMDQLSVAGLVEFVQRCPKLAIFQVPFLDVRGPLLSLHSLPPEGLKNLHSLSFFKLIGGREANLLALAVVLDILFPSAGRLHSVTVEKDIKGIAVLVGNENYQAACVTMMLLGAMWARRQGEEKRLVC